MHFEDVSLGLLSPAPFSIDIGTSENLVVNASRKKIMSKANYTSKLRIEGVEAFTLDLGGDATFTVREVRDDETESERRV